MPNREEITQWFQTLQNSICNALEEADGLSKFKEDKWERKQGGGGRSRIIENGNILEKGGVNFSAVHGDLPENIKKAIGVTENDFYATGISIVLHPNNPWIPIIHMNTRYFEVGKSTYWFGGGIDLTPHYVMEDQAEWFHQQMQNVCDEYDKSYYPKFSQWADDYFYIKHRKETRGIGGIFFDKLKEDNQHSKKNVFDFVKAVGSSFVPTYMHLIELNKDKPFTEKEKQWQLLRRGRYVEFNLVYDKGTKFGLDTDGRIESILMSLPTTASWLYDFKPQADSLEEKTLHYLKK